MRKLPNKIIIHLQIGLLTTLFSNNIVIVFLN